MNEEEFWADVEEESVSQELFRAVLVIGVRNGDEEEDPIRLPLAGEHRTPEEARAAAWSVIKAMAEDSR